MQRTLKTFLPPFVLVVLVSITTENLKYLIFRDFVVFTDYNFE